MYLYIKYYPILYKINLISQLIPKMYILKLKSLKNVVFYRKGKKNAQYDIVLLMTIATLIKKISDFSPM